MKLTNQLLFCTVLCTTTTCDSSREPGTLRIDIYGEEFIEDEIPADVFVDGWTMRFDKFLVSAGDVTAAAGHDSEPGLENTQYRVFDLSAPSTGAGHLVTSATVDGGLYDHLGYRIAPATSAVAGNAAPGDVDFLVDAGFAIYVEGTATKGSDTKTFAWGFSRTTHYGDCETTADVDGNEASSQITIHADHLFYDDIFSADPNVAFDLIAEADADSDQEVTRSELLALDISTQERYQVGSLNIDNLWDFIDYLTTTVGHVDGEGHCETITRE